MSLLNFKKIEAKLLKRKYFRPMANKRKPVNFELFNLDSTSGVANKNKALKRSIIHFVDRKGSSSITDFSKELKTSVPKTTALVNELIEWGLIQDEGKIDSRHLWGGMTSFWLIGDNNIDRTDIERQQQAHRLDWHARCAYTDIQRWNIRRQKRISGC